MFILKSFTIFTLFFLLSLSCASTQTSSHTSREGKKPDWVTNPETAYPENQYMAAVGEGDTLDSANSRAKASLSARFRVKIDSSLDVRSEYRELKKDGILTSTSSEEAASQDIRETTSEELINLKYGKNWTDGATGRVYAAVYLNRMETAQIYTDKIEKNAENIRFFSEKASEQESLLEKYAYLNMAFILAAHNHMLKEQLGIIHRPSVTTLNLNYSMNNIRTEYAEIAGRMTFSIDIKNDTEGKLTDIIKSILSDEGFSTIDGDNGFFILEGSLDFQEIELENRYTNLRWHLALSIKENGSSESLVSYEKSARESGISHSAAISRCYTSMKNEVEKNLFESLKKHFQSYLQQ